MICFGGKDFRKSAVRKIAVGFLGQDEPESDGGQLPQFCGSSSFPTIFSGVSTRWKRLRELLSLLLLVFGEYI